MTIYKSGTTAFQSQTAGTASKSASPAPAAPGGSSYWYSTAAATAADYQRWDLASADTWQFRRLVYLDAASATDIDLLAFRTGADAGNNLIVRIQGTDKLRVVANGGTFAYTSTVSFPHDGWYRLEGYGSAVNNTARVALFPVTSTTAVIDSGDITVAQGSLAPTGVRLGKLSNTTGYAGIVAWDEDEVRTGVDAALTFIGPYPAPTVTAVVSPASADTGVARTLTLTIANGNGNPVTWGPVTWEGTTDAAVATAAGVTSKTFTRTPTVAGAGKSGSYSWSQA